MNNNELMAFLEDFLNKFKIKIQSIKTLSGGSISNVLLINNKFVVKLFNQKQIKSEYMFFKTYKNPPFQKIIFCEKNFNYIVYKFYSGKTRINCNKQKYLKKMIYIVKNEKNSSLKGFGYLNEPFESFFDFLTDEVNYSYNEAKQVLTEKEFQTAIKAIELLKKFKVTKKLIHGDLGTHNILTTKNKITAIIDSDAVLGDNLYDILTLICSDVTLLKMLNIKKIALKFNSSILKVKLMLVVTLFIRLSRSFKYHKNDFDFYKKFWTNFEKCFTEINA